MSTPFRIAVLATEFSPRSHVDVIVSRWVDPLASDAKYGWASPQTRIASLYVEQSPENDMSGTFCEVNGIPKFSSIAEALTLGGDHLAVDAIILIAEHGRYPLNEFQQKLYPRKEMFDQVVEVFRRSEKVVPLFLDKHLSWNPQWAHEMYWQIKDLDIPFLGGSSLTHCPLYPAMPRAAGPGGYKEIVAMYSNEVESYLFHGLEVIEAVIERAPRGHIGIKSITAWQNDEAWDALERGEFSATLFEQSARAASEEALSSLRQLREERGQPVYAFQLRYADGLKLTQFMTHNVVRKWSLACEYAGSNSSTASACVDPGTRAEFHPSFARLNCQIQNLFLTGMPPISPNRLYLTTMATAGCMHALAKPGTPFHAPWLDLPVERQFAMA